MVEYKDYINETLIKKETEMTDIFKNENKLIRRRKLLSAAKIALIKDGWEILHAPEAAGRAVFRINRNNESHLVSIRTTQDQWFAFLPLEEGGWKTLDYVDKVIVSSVDVVENPKEAWVYMFEAEYIRERFDKAYAARTKDGKILPFDRGMWVSLFVKDDSITPHFIGGGVAIDKDRLLRIRFDEIEIETSQNETESSDENDEPEINDASPQKQNLIIHEVKRLLSESLGVSVDKIRITIEA